MPKETTLKSILTLIFHFSTVMVSSVTWLTFSPITYRTADYFNCSMALVNALSIAFLMAALPFGVVAFYVLERFGLRKSLLASAWVNAFGTCLRLLSTLENISGTSRLIFLCSGQFIVASVAPLPNFTPATTAALWFPASKRTLVNAIINLANPVGVIFVGSVSPRFIDQDGKLMGFGLLLPSAVMALLSALFGTFVMSEPEPAVNVERMALQMRKSNSVKTDIKKLFRNGKYVILLLCCGGGIGLYSSMIMSLEQLLCPIGYNAILTGLASTTLTATGLVGSITVCCYCDFTKQLSTALKGSFIIVSLGLMGFSVIIILQKNIGNYILMFFSLFGFFAMGILPIGSELAIESSYPVSEATTTGLIQQMGYLQGMLLALLIQITGRPMSVGDAASSGSVCQLPNVDDVDTSLQTSEMVSNYTNTTTVTPSSTTTTNDSISSTVDFTISVCMIAGYTTALVLLLISCFKPKYKRRELEAEEKEKLSKEETSSNRDELMEKILVT